jgi:pyrroloquinoline-quinone synthase
MDSTHVEAELERALADRQLLTHAFYQRWSNGELTNHELQRYAGQYRHFEAAMPQMLRNVIAQLPEGKPRDIVSENLADEVGPVSHLQLFDEFATALGADCDAQPTPATANLVSTYEKLSKAGPVQGLAALLAYESQVPAVAATKSAGLQHRYGMSSGACAFWDVHSTMDIDHSRWTVDALAAIAGDAGTITDAARLAADAWWEMLDERETEAALAVPA